MFRKKSHIIADISSINYSDVTIEKSSRWSVYADIKLIGRNTRKEHNELVYLHICSPSFASSPGDELIDSKTLILDFLNKDLVERKINDYISEANSRKFKNWKEYYGFLSKYFDID